ncbi:MAG: hypothetical protein M3Y58_21575 [Chloroflexota bacterium]|nr:hypothetical protein [Chloroflexota bacterium]
MEGEFFKELGPIFAGCLLPLFLGAFLRRGWTPRAKFLVTIAASVSIGALATLLSGEFAASWAFVLLDVAEVFVASQIIYFCIYRPLHHRRERQRMTVQSADGATEHA